MFKKLGLVALITVGGIGGSGCTTVSNIRDSSFNEIAVFEKLARNIEENYSINIGKIVETPVEKCYFLKKGYRNNGNLFPSFFNEIRYCDHKLLEGVQGDSIAFSIPVNGRVETFFIFANNSNKLSYMGKVSDADKKKSFVDYGQADVFYGIDEINIKKILLDNADFLSSILDTENQRFR